MGNLETTTPSALPAPYLQSRAWRHSGRKNSKSNKIIKSSFVLDHNKRKSGKDNYGKNPQN